MNKRKFMQSYSVYDLILIAMLSAITIAIKTVVGILVRLITGPLGIPGGALAGGFYMLWLALGLALIDKKGVAFFIALVQAIVLLITGLPGSHGVWTFFTYLIPGIAVEFVFLFKKNGYNILNFIIAIALANMLGTFGSNLLFFRMSALPLAFTLVAAAFSGCLGGIIGYMLYKKIDKSGLLKKKKVKQKNSEDVAEKEDII
jgi:ABC-type thiamin/hydroxymethylpyrimidine transport system permease subunit